MQTAAKINLVLINLSDNAGLGDVRAAVGDDRSYLHAFMKELAQSFHSRQAFQELTDKLIRLAEHAYCLRDMKTVQEVGLILMNLPMDSARQVGQYYQALAFKRNGKKDEAQASLELVAEDAPLTYRARALQALGTIYHGQGQLDDALRLYIESAHAAQYQSHPNLLTYLMAHFQVSFIKSDIGDHPGALTDLENLLPLVRHTAKQSPFYFYAYHADLAFELAQLGRLTEAEAASAIALASPFAPAYPEWTETRNEIAAKHRSASRSTVAINRTLEADPSQHIELERKRRRVSALASSWPVPKEDSVQRCIIAIACASALNRFGITQVILYCLRKCVRTRGPPALLQETFRPLSESILESAEKKARAEQNQFAIQCFCAQSYRLIVAISVRVSTPC